MGEHVDITDPEIHEPLDVSTASVGTVYIADGAGSGSWGIVAIDAPGVEVIVTSSEDFPAPLSNIITLLSNTKYVLNGNVDIDTARVVLGTNTSLVGQNPKADKLASVTTGTLVTGTGGAFLKDISLLCATGKAYSFTGGSTERLTIDGVIVEDCTTVGTITGYGNVSVDMEVVAATTAGLNFTGSIGTAVINLKSSSWTGSLLNLGTAVFDFLLIGHNGAYNTASGNTGITVASSSANIEASGIGIISGNRFSGAGTDLSGYTVGDVRWVVESNSSRDSATREVAVAAGGLEVNNTLTGSGFERAMTVSDRTSLEVYTPTNVVTDRSYDANATTLDEVADVLGTLIADLQAIDIIQ